MFKVKEGLLIGGKAVTGSGPSAVLTAADVGTGAYSPAFNYANPGIIGTANGVTIGHGTTTTYTPLTVDSFSGNGDSARGIAFNISGANYGRILIPSGSGGAMAFWTGGAGAAVERYRISAAGAHTWTGTLGNMSLAADAATLTFSRNGDNYLAALGGASANLNIQATSNILLYTNSIERYRITNAGQHNIVGSYVAFVLGSGAEYSGISVRCTEDSSSVSRTSYIDFQNNLAMTDSHMFVQHKPDGSSSILLGVTPPGSRSVDRRVGVATVTSTGLSVYNSTYGATILMGASTNGAGQIGFDTTLTLSNPALSGNNLNTFLNAPNGYISFRVTNSEKMVLTSGGLLGIGHSDPGNWYSKAPVLLVNKNHNAGTIIGIGNTTVGATAVCSLNYIGGTANSYAEFSLIDNNGAPYYSFGFGSGVVSASFTMGGTESFRIMQSGGNTRFYRAISELKTAPTISTGTLTLDLQTGAMFAVSLNAAITTLTLSNPPPSGNLVSFILEFTADGTARSVTWPAAVKWPGGTNPTLTSTNGKKDVFSFYTYDGGTTYIGAVVGQNF